MRRILFGVSLALACMTGCTLAAKESGSGWTPDTTVPHPGEVWWTEDGVIKPDYKLTAFAAYDRLNLEEDIARGRGECLASLGFMLGVHEDFRMAFEAAAQQRFRDIVSGDRIPLQLLHALVQ